MPGARRARGESGETLAELIVTIAIVGLAVAAIVAALATGISASSTHRQRASADTVARSVAEAIKDRKVALDPNGVYPPSTWTGGTTPPIVDTSGFTVTVAVGAYTNPPTVVPFDPPLKVMRLVLERGCQIAMF